MYRKIRDIALRFRPFSHEPGTLMMFPASRYVIRAFPSRLQILACQEGTWTIQKEVGLSISGPVKDFTVQQDLEKGVLRVWGKGIKGFFRYYITSLEKDSGVGIHFEKVPENCELRELGGRLSSRISKDGELLISGDTLIYSDLPDDCIASGHRRPLNVCLLEITRNRIG